MVDKYPDRSNKGCKINMYKFSATRNPKHSRVFVNDTLMPRQPSRSRIGGGYNKNGQDSRIIRKGGNAQV